MTKNRLGTIALRRENEIQSEILYQETLQNYYQEFSVDDEGRVSGIRHPYPLLEKQTSERYIKSFKKILGKKLYKKVKHVDSHPILNTIRFTASCGSIILGCYLGNKMSEGWGILPGGLIGLVTVGWPINYMIEKSGLQERYKKKILPKLKKENPEKAKYIDAYFN